MKGSQKKKTIRETQGHEEAGHERERGQRLAPGEKYLVKGGVKRRKKKNTDRRKESSRHSLKLTRSEKSGGELKGGRQNAIQKAVLKQGGGVEEITYDDPRKFQRLRTRGERLATWETGGNAGLKRIIISNLRPFKALWEVATDKKQFGNKTIGRQKELGKKVKVWQVGETHRDQEGKGNMGQEWFSNQEERKTHKEGSNVTGGYRKGDPFGESYLIGGEKLGRGEKRQTGQGNKFHRKRLPKKKVKRGAGTMGPL